MSAKPRVQSGSNDFVEKGTPEITVEILRLWDTMVNNLVEEISAGCQTDVNGQMILNLRTIRHVSPDAR